MHECVFLGLTNNQQNKNKWIGDLLKKEKARHRLFFFIFSLQNWNIYFSKKQKEQIAFYFLFSSHISSFSVQPATSAGGIDLVFIFKKKKLNNKIKRINSSLPQISLRYFVEFITYISLKKTKKMELALAKSKF